MRVYCPSCAHEFMLRESFATDPVQLRQNLTDCVVVTQWEGTLEKNCDKNGRLGQVTAAVVVRVSISAGGIELRLRVIGSDDGNGDTAKRYHMQSLGL